MIYSSGADWVAHDLPRDVIGRFFWVEEIRFHNLDVPIVLDVEVYGCSYTQVRK